MGELINRFKRSKEHLKTGKDFVAWAGNTAVELAFQDPGAKRLATDKDEQDMQEVRAKAYMREAKILSSRTMINEARGEDGKIDWYSLSPEQIRFLNHTAWEAGFVHEIGVKSHELETLAAIVDIDQEQIINFRQLHRD